MKVKFSKEFSKQLIKLKDKGSKLEILKKVKRLKQEYKSKKHLKNVLSGKQTIRTKSKRILYKVNKNIIEICSVKPRKDAYKV